jgi:predicted permease
MLGRGTGALLVYGELVTGSYFDVLGVSAQLGRVLQPSDDVVRGGHPVAVLSDALWRREFGADPAVIGRTIEVARARLTVVGVADATFHGSAAGLETALFVPYAMQPELDGTDRLDDARTPWVFAFGRPRPGVSLAQARAESVALSAELARELPAEGFGQRAVVIPIWQSPQGAQTYMLPAVSLMGVMSLLLLLVVCANVAGLVLVRGLGRRAEIGVRLALGASRARVVRLLLVENLLLAVPGALAGLWLVRLEAPYLFAAQPSVAGLPPLFFNVGTGPDVRVALLLACVSTLAAGLVPALRASRLDLATVMKDDLAPSGAGKNRLRSGLVVVQVTMALLLLVGTALVARSLGQARQASPGFDAHGVASMWLVPDSDGTRVQVFYRSLLDELRADPAIDAASVMKNPLLVLFDMNTAEFRPESSQRPRDEDVRFGFNVVGPDYFRTLRMPLVAGREFDGGDVPSAEKVAVVNETLARRFWGDPAAAIGQRLQTEAWSLGWLTVVGVARDSKYARLTEPPRPYVYLPHAQANNDMMFVLARGPSGPAALDALRRHVRELDATMPVMQEGMLAGQTNLGLGIYDVTARVLGMVGLAGIGLMAIGIYGLVAYTVRQSAHETGIRMAIGASRPRIVGRFLLRGLWLGIAGAALGIAAALALTRLMASMLYGVAATDTVSFVVAAAAVLATTLAASLVPAWRASRADPLVVLRHH